MAGGNGVERLWGWMLRGMLVVAWVGVVGCAGQANSGGDVGPVDGVASEVGDVGAVDLMGSDGPLVDGGLG